MPTTRSERGAGRERAEVELQRIGLVNDQPFGVCDAARQRGRKLAIDLDDVQALELLAAAAW